MFPEHIWEFNRWYPCRMGELTTLLERMHAGDRAARDALFAAAYSDLRRLAHARLGSNGADGALNTTSLVHESYLRYVDAGELRAEDRRSFFGYASQVMRSIIVNTARDRLAGKRGGGAAVLSLSDQDADIPVDGHTVLQVHDALEVLEQADPRSAQIVQMKYFGGYSEQEIAETLGITARTVQRDWEKARLMLAAALR
jgi:RNA polymerase sigma factor (TIGR02999 family)